MKVLRKLLLCLVLTIIFLGFPNNTYAYDIGWGINVSELNENGQLILPLNETKKINFELTEDGGYQFKGCKTSDNFPAQVVTEENSCLITTNFPGYFSIEVELAYDEYNSTSVFIPVYAGEEFINEQINKIYFSNKDLTYGEYLMLQKRNITIPRYFYTSSNCEFNIDTATYNCNNEYDLSEYNSGYKYSSFGGNIVGPIKYEYNVYVDPNTSTDYPLEGIDKNNTLFLSEDDSIAYYKNNTIFGVNAGETRIYLINRNNLEIRVANIYVRETKYENVSNMTFSQLTEKLNTMPEVFTVDIQDTNEKGSYITEDWMYSNLAPSIIFEYLFDKEYSSEIGYNDFAGLSANCDANGVCTVSFYYREDKDSWEQFAFTSKEFTLNIEGIDLWNIAPNAEDNFYLNNIIINYLPKKDNNGNDITYEYDFEYDSNYISYDEENDIITFLKSGVTQITVSTGEYSATQTIYIGLSNDDFHAFAALNNTNNTIALDYAAEDFEDNLDVLASIVYDKYASIIPANILEMAKMNVVCLSSEICVVAYEDEHNILRSISSFAKKITYNETSEDFKNIDEITNNLKDIYLIPFDEYIKINNAAKGDKETYYDKLIDTLGINEYLEDSNYTVKYTNEIETSLFENIYGNYELTLEIFYNNKNIFSKNIKFIALPFMDIPLEESHTNIGRVKYAENYLKDILTENEIVCSVDTANTNVINAQIDGEYNLKFAFVQDDYISVDYLNSAYTAYELEVGDTVQIEMVYYPENVNVLPQMEYRSLNDKVATVSETGLIEAKSQGFVPIRYIADGGRHQGDILVLVGMTIDEFLDSVVDDIENTVVISYGAIRGYEEQAVRESLEYKTYDNLLGTIYLETNIEKDGDNYYFYKTFREYHPEYLEHNSKRQIVNYTLKGIYIEKENYSIKSGSSVKVDISYTEGNNNKLFYRTDKPGIIYFDPVTGVLTGLNSGITRVDVYDERGTYYNFFYAYVNEDAYFENLLAKIARDGIKIDINQARWGVENNFEWPFKEAIGYITDEVYYTCDEENEVCDVTFIANEKEYNVVVPYHITGILLQNEPEYYQGYGDFDLEIGDTLQIEAINYALSSDKNLSYESSDASICNVSSTGLITGLNPGVCEIKIKNADGDSQRMAVVVAREQVAQSLDEVFDLLPDEIDLKMKRYTNEIGSGDEVELYLIMLNRILQNYVGDSSYYFSFGLEELVENNDDTLTVEFTKYYVSPDGYFITSIGSPSSKRIKVNFLEDEVHGDKNAQKIIDSLKKEYDLSMVEALRYQFDQSEHKEIWRYCGDFLKTISNYPGYEYIFDGRAGTGDTGYSATEGGYIILVYNGAPIYMSTAFFTATFVAPHDAPKTQDEFTRYLTELIIDAYEEINQPAIFTYNTRQITDARATMYAATNVPDVTVEYKKSSGTSELYWVTVDTTEFGLEVVRSEGEDTPIEPPVETVKSITLNKDTLSMNVGDTYQLTYTITPSSLANQIVNWSTSNSKVATVKNGKVTAVSEGTATITVKVDGKSDKVTVNVKGVTLKGILSEIGYKLTSSFVKGFTLNEKISSLQKKLGSNVKITSTKDIVSTGTQFKLDGQAYTVVINGDITGDGLINSADLLAMRQHLLGTKILSGAYKDAAAIVNGQTINSSDLLRLRQYLLGEFIIKQ